MNYGNGVAMDDNDYVLAFDHFYTNNHIQILKSLLPFIEGENSAMLPVFIKYMELKHTISLAGKKGNGMHNGGIFASSVRNEKKSPGGIKDNIEEIYNAVRRYLAPGEDKEFSQLISAIRTMKNMREMQHMMEMLQSLNPDGEKDGKAGSFDALSALSALGGLGDMDIDINELMQLLNNNGGS